MDIYKKYRSSSFLLILAIILLGLGAVMAYYVNAAVEDIKYDAEIINETGSIRGSIQRATKLVISDSTINPQDIILAIDNMFLHFMTNDFLLVHKGVGLPLYEQLVQLKCEWIELKILFADYQISSQEIQKNQIIIKSEFCWQLADSAVLSAQHASEGKIGSFDLFYQILALNAITAISVILFAVFNVRKKLEFESIHDSLTGIHNRRLFESIIHSEIARSSRYSSKLSLILVDVDKFKQINDNFGHDYGDDVLTDLAGIIHNSVRESDIVFRLGGDEFAVICPETTADHALQVAESIRKKVEQHRFKTETTVTISMGISEFSTGLTKEKMYQFADKALYSAKNSGRNTIKLYS